MKHPHMPSSSRGFLFPQWLPDSVWEDPKTSSTGHYTKVSCLWEFTWTRATVQGWGCQSQHLVLLKHCGNTNTKYKPSSVKKKKKKKNQVNTICCGCCKSFQIGLVWNTEKLNPSQEQKKQFNLDNSINRLVMCLPAGRMRLWVFKW